MRPVLLADAPEGELADVFARLEQRQKGTTRDGKPFYTLKFRDARRHAGAVIWGDADLFNPCDKEWRVGDYFKIRGRLGTHEKYGPQLEILKIRHAADADRADGFDEKLFGEHSRFDVGVMLAELTKVAEEELSDSAVRALVSMFLDRFGQELGRLPASARHYYPFAGGWLEHTLNVARHALWLADRYLAHYPDRPELLDRDIVLAGAVFHECGRLREFTPDEPPGVTVEGSLFGHLALGRDLVRELAAEIPDFPAEKRMILEHVVLSHLALPEWGSPRLPAVLESLIVHHLDDLDAKIEMFARALRDDGSDGPMTGRDPILGRPLLKSRSWTETAPKTD